MRRTSFLQCFRILSVCALLLSFTSCEQDEDVVFGRLVRYTWVGDLGFSDPGENHWKAVFILTATALGRMSSVITEAVG